MECGVIPYASWTGTYRNLDALRKAGWHLLTGPHIMWGHGWKAPLWTDKTVAPHALDNGAWSAYQKQEPFNGPAFERALDVAGHSADWIVVPDIVAGGRKSLEFSLSWLERMKQFKLNLLAVQDGMEPCDVQPHLSNRVGIFVGGTTEWKLDTMCRWGELARDVGCYLHIGRVNSCRRIRLCQKVGAHSFDGTSATRFASTIPRLDNARRQKTIWELV